MRLLLLSLTLLLATGDRTADRDALLAADRSLSEKTAARGMVQGFLPSMTEGAAYLYPGAPLLRGYTYGWTHAGGTRGKYLACWRKTGSVWRLAAYASTRPVPVPESAAPAAPSGALGAQVRGRADPSELLRADSAFAALSVTSGAKNAFLAFAAEEAMSFGGGTQMTQGRQAIGAGFDGFPVGAVLEWWPVAAEIAPSGDLGCTVGEATIASLNHYSKYLTIWRRQPDGTWKFVAELEGINELRGNRLEELDVAPVPVVDVDMDLRHPCVGAGAG